MASSKYVACVVALLVAACRTGGSSSDAGPRPMCTVDDVPVACDPGTGGSTYVYVMSQLVYPEASVDAVEPGFNLDGNADQVCGADDWMGPGPALVCGIDNQLAPLLSRLLGTSQQDAVDTGQLILLVAVSGVDDLHDDACVSVRLALGVLPDGGRAPLLDADGHLASGQPFDLEARSLGADGLTWVYAFSGARIVGGRLQSSGGEALLPFATSDSVVVVTPLHAARIDAALDADGMHDGVLGGTCVATDILDALQREPRLCTYVSMVGPILAAQSDLAPMDVTLDGGRITTRCSRISVGVTFEAVSATLSTCASGFDCDPSRSCVGTHCTAPAPDAGTPCSLDGGRD